MRSIPLPTGIPTNEPTMYVPPPAARPRGILHYPKPAPSRGRPVRIRVKICGITTPDALRAAVDAGADAVGLVFAESPRRVTPEQAASLARAVPPSLARVGVFKHPDPDLLRAVAAAMSFDCAQSEAEDADRFQAFPAPFLPVFRDAPDLLATVRRAHNRTATVREREDLPSHHPASPSHGLPPEWSRLREQLNTPAPPHLQPPPDLAPPRSFFSKLILIESHSSGAGTPPDWPRVAAVAREYPIVLAGGLTPDNVAHAIDTVRPSAVDVSSGVESHPGLKDPARIYAFLAAVRAAERDLNSRPG